MDYYLEHPEELKGQPKRTIGDYVEKNGLLVPKRFDSLEDAKKSGLPFIARSEHVQDYNGASGVVVSPQYLSLDMWKIETYQQLKDFVLKDERCSKHILLCKLTNYDRKKFEEEFSFSFWELLGGYNRTVAADSAVKNRYHVLTAMNPHSSNEYTSYSIVENFEIKKEYKGKLTEDLRETIPDLIESYERVRNLDKFDSNHCPLMEFQTVDKKNYFLQYHRTRNFVPANFVLEREREEGEIEVPFVRGVTEKEGMKCKVTVYYYAPKGRASYKPENEDGSWNFHNNKIFSELQSRKNKVQTNNIWVEISREFQKACVRHESKSLLFKPQVSIMQKIGDMYKEGENIIYFQDESLRGHNSFMNLYIISDGRKCYIKRLD